MNEHEVTRNVLLSVAAATDAFSASGHAPVRAAGAGTAALLRAVAVLLEDRTPEEVERLIYTLARKPAVKADLDGPIEAIREAIARRLREDA